MEEIKSISKKTNFGNTTSILFLIVVILGTVGLHFYNNMLIENVTKIKTNISVIESNIVDVKKDKHLQIYSLLELNKEYINQYKLMNNVTKYINHMNVISGKYNVEFSGFNLSNGEIKTNIKIVSDNKGIAFEKTRDFIKKYRNDSKALFDLSFIRTVEGMDEIKFKVIFKIK